MNAILKFFQFLFACLLGAITVAIGLNVGSDIYQAKIGPHVQNRLLSEPEASETGKAE